jgi:hypothetical protein
VRDICCTGPIIPFDTRIQGIKTLFAIIAIVQKVDELGEEDYGHDATHQLELMATGYDAIEEAIVALTDEERARFEKDPEYSTLMTAFAHLKPLVEDVDRDRIGFL